MICHQALMSPIASDLMSSPLRKRIRSPDLREALSAGLPGSEKRPRAGQLGSTLCEPISQEQNEKSSKRKPDSGLQISH